MKDEYLESNWWLLPAGFTGAAIGLLVIWYFADGQPTGDAV